MNVIINGAGGRMGKVLCQMIGDRFGSDSHISRVDAFVTGDGYVSTLADCTQPADCIIDFSNHQSTAELMAYAVANKLPVVIATTGQTEEEMEMIRSGALEVPVFFSGNMSLGIALLAQLAKMTAKIFPYANVEIVEKHHNQKLDVPSGTALMLANSVKASRPEAEFLVGRHEHGKRTDKEVGIHSLRLGNVVGEHEVIVNTGTQTISLKHEAHDRSLFAEGALSAAEFLITQKAGLYNMDHMTAII